MDTLKKIMYSSNRFKTDRIWHRIEYISAGYNFRFSYIPNWCCTKSSVLPYYLSIVKEILIHTFIMSINGKLKANRFAKN